LIVRLVQMTKHKLHNALDELERKVALEIEKSFEQFTMSATKILNNLIESSDSHSKNIINLFKGKVVDLRSYIDSNVTEIVNDDAIPPVCNYLRLRPMNELLEKECSYEQEYYLAELSEQPRKKQINSEIIEKCEKQRNKSLNSSTTIDNVNQDKRFYVFLSGSWIAGGGVQVGPSRFVSNRTEIFKCKRCNNRFTDISILQGHFCPANTDSIDENDILNEAETTNKRTKMSLYKCCTCDQKFKNKALLKAHAKHHSSKPFRCVKCNYRGRNQSDLYNHLNSNAHCKLKFQCNTCSYACKHSVSLEEHVKRVHKTNKQVQCFVCKERFENNNLLKNHFCPLLDAK